jgi:hypothetical protein
MTDDADDFYRMHDRLAERLGEMQLPRSLTSHWLLFTGALDEIWVAADVPTASGSGRVVCASKTWITVYSYSQKTPTAEDTSDADVFVVARRVANIARVDSGTSSSSVSVALYFRDGSDPLLLPLNRGDNVDKLFQLLELLKPVQ